MTSFTAPSNPPSFNTQALLNGKITLATRPYTPWGGAVTAQMYLPLTRAIAWQKLTDYPRWVQYFPALTRSEVRDLSKQAVQGVKRLYQVASKNFFLFTANAEICLDVIETTHQQIQFHLAEGSFHDFSAELNLQDYQGGTLLTYSVQATPTIPIPAMFIEQAIQMDLPANMRNMRQVLCR